MRNLVNIEGDKLGGSGYNESSMVKVETVAKTSKGTVAQAPKYKGDASKVECKGMGLKKAFPGRPSIFNIDCGKAGLPLLPSFPFCIHSNPRFLSSTPTYMLYACFQ